MNYCSYFSYAYLDKFLALHESVERHCGQPYIHWALPLDDDALEAMRWINPRNVRIVPFEEVETDTLRQVKPFRTRKEYIWSCRATWMLWLLKQHISPLMYLDDDMWFMGSPEPVFEEIGGHDIAICPHRFPPRLRHFEINGIYNSGTVYMDYTPRALECLRRWEVQLVDWCYHRHDEHEQFGDQRYLDEWPDRWGAHIIQHKGFNLAPWNQMQYSYLRWREEPHGMYVDTQPLILYHFHQGLEPKYRLDPFVRTHLYEPYRQALADANRMAYQ